MTGQSPAPGATDAAAEGFRPPPGLFGRPTRSRRYIVYCRAFAFASAVHLFLPEALEPDWLFADLCYWVGLVLLAVNGSVAGWALCAAGLAIPIFALGDVLTQSGYLLGCALGALACAAGGRTGLEARLGLDFPAVVRTLTVLLYAIAALHKLNRGFLDPELSCAVRGMEVLADNWAIDALAAPAIAPYWPLLFLAAELGLVVFFVARPAAAMVVAVLMHIPLTIVFAPSFAFTMISGWVSFFGEDELDHAFRRVRQRWGTILLAGGGVGLLSFVLYLQRHWVVYAFWSLKEALLWLLFVWLLVAWWRRPSGIFGWLSAWRERPSRRGRWVASAFGVLFVANGLLPYTGLSFHRSGAMLSNLRVDDGCWNSLVFPEWIRVTDPYVHVDEAVIDGPVRRRRKLEGELETTLFDRFALEARRERLCIPGAAPIHLRGTFDGRRFELDDLCARAFPLGRPRLPTVVRHQRELPADCAQMCVH